MKSLLAILLLLNLAACSPSPSGAVPEESFWVRGEYANVWVNLGEVEQNRFYASIYNDEGLRIKEGWFVFRAVKDAYDPKGVDAEYIERYMNGFDGEAIYITDIAAGRALIYYIQTP